MTTSDEPKAKRRPGRPAVGRDSPLTLDAILAEAQRIIREEGLDALTNRRLAAALGVTPNSLYRYVPDKAGLLELLITQVWEQTATNVGAPTDDLTEWVIRGLLDIRRVWLDNIELASLALNLGDPASSLGNDRILTAILQAAGFPDVPGAYYAIQTLTLGSVAITAARRRGSAYFGRDPDAILEQTRELLDAEDADDDLRGTSMVRFDVGDERHFETTLRLMVTALLAERPS